MEGERDEKQIIEEQGSGKTYMVMKPKAAITSAKRWLIFCFILAILQFGVIGGIIMTWILEYSNARTLVLLTLWEILTIVSVVMVLVLIVMYISWGKNDLDDMTGSIFMTVFVIVEIVSLISLIAELIWRIVLKINCSNGVGDPGCDVNPQLSVSITLLVFNSISLFITLMLLVVGIILYLKISNLRVTKTEYTQKKQQAETYATSHQTRMQPTQMKHSQQYFSPTMRQRPP
jgi:hypothetical protein